LDFPTISVNPIYASQPQIDREPDNAEQKNHKRGQSPGFCRDRTRYSAYPSLQKIMGAIISAGQVFMIGAA